ncbi:MAG: hypothetical protein IKL79_05830 [Clostridia bacterium]|nr:hypothetical protein [Clostridia bacterium]
MRKAISIILVAAFVILLSACSAEKPKIEDYEWKMRIVTHVEDGRIIYDAADEEADTYEGASIVEMTLVASDGKITLTDLTNGKAYTGSYTVSGKNPEGTDYRITLDGKTGYATVAMTTYADGREEPTLPISLDGYSIYFYAE